MDKTKTAAVPAENAGSAVSQEQINTWKRKYPKVFEYELEDGQKLYFRQPDRKVISAAGIVAKNDPMKYNEFVLNNCFLGGDKTLLDDDSVFFGLSQVIDEMVSIKAGQLKNL